MFSVLRRFAVVSWAAARGFCNVCVLMAPSVTELIRSNGGDFANVVIVSTAASVAAACEGRPGVEAIIMPEKRCKLRPRMLDFGLRDIFPDFYYLRRMDYVSLDIDDFITSINHKKIMIMLT